MDFTFKASETIFWTGAIRTNRLGINAYPPLRVRMSEKIISAETLKFVRRSFESVWALELILMMRRENTRCWSVSELTQQLRASELLVGGILPDLVRKGLVLETALGMFQYRSAAVELEQLVDKVAVAYAENRIRLLVGCVLIIFAIVSRNRATAVKSDRRQKSQKNSSLNGPNGRGQPYCQGMAGVSNWRFSLALTG